MPRVVKPTGENIGNMRCFFGEIGRMKGVDYLWELRGAGRTTWSSMCRELRLVHAVDPFVSPSLTPELLYGRLHGIGSAYASDTCEQQLHEWLPRAADAYAMFNNIPRVGDAKRFMEL